VPVPNTILDRKALTQALEDAGLSIKSKYINYLYEHLHRSNYPPLQTFVQEYKKVVAEHPADTSISSDDSTCVSTADGGSVKSSRRHSLHYRFTRHRLPTKLLDFVANPSNGFVTTTSKVVGKKASPTGNSCKIVIALHDGLLVETNIMRYHEQSGDRACVSVSSQVGCDVGCTFCPVASTGFKGNLTAGEIEEQVVHAQQVFARDYQMDCAHVVQKVTFMGSGEPLNNFDNVVNACHSLANKWSWNLCRGRITISTVGITPRIYDLTRELPNVVLALGLHAPTQVLRRAIVPVAEQYPLEELMAALDNHMNDPLDRMQGALLSPSGRRRRMVMVEYIMMEGKTSSFECAHELGRLCESRHLVVNLIPYIIQGNAEDKRSCPSPAHIKEFQSIVASYGAICNVRLNMSVELTKMVARQMGLNKQQSLDDVPTEIEDLGFWQKLSFVRSRGWNKEALRNRQESRLIPREIIAKKSRNGSNDDSKTTAVTEIVTSLVGSAVDGVANLVSSGPSTNEGQNEPSFEDKEIASTEACDYHSARRWILPAALAAVVLCRIMLFERRR